MNTLGTLGMDKQRLAALAALTLLPLAVACGSEDAGSDSVGAGASASVTGAYWAVDDVTVDGKKSAAPSNAYLRIADGGEVKGNLGCNNFGADAVFADSHVTFDQMQATEMACEGVPVNFEQTLARTLSDGDLTTEVEGDKLTLSTADGDRVTLTKQEAAPLYGTKWTVTSPDADGKAHLTFDEKAGEVSGSLGCNKVKATATVSDGRITLGTASTTRMMCDTSLMNTEKTLLGLFDGTVKYELDHRNLTLTSENGEHVNAAAAE
ncbi:MULTISPECIES: META domain-containing protein [unclassified Streptomyces]|uniref:META domain-containing protein n=1 Tax=unclassified Streptomyces TaxID=2593676 RepID=UPI002365F45B|nr:MULTISPECIES: META domain-containing protein [unclassified Streptomyces]MDF3141389.1 META domain-containing protein [Streptomyces sp. T21Q-yed]WDF39420.1 META domain-containing protein [Streptomyces sp. T12]